MTKYIIAGLMMCGAAQVAHAQISAAPMRSALPQSSSIGLSNAVGALQYCASRHLVSSTSADAVYDGLAKRHPVPKSADFTAGASGEIIGDRRFSIGSAPGFLQSQACALVLNRVKEFLK